jgi:hypothetical protein
MFFLEARMLVSGNEDVFDFVRGGIYDVYARQMDAGWGFGRKGLKWCQGKFSY